MIKIDGCYDAKTIQRKLRLIASIWGDDKQGKTHFALTAPGPIVYINFDYGLEGVIEKFSDKKEIKVCDVQYTSDQASAAAAWGKFVSTYEQSLIHPDVRTIVVDTGTQAWALMRLVHFGKLSGVMPTRYEKPNTQFQQWLDRALKCDKNVIILHKSGKEYINDKYTGGQEIKCYSNMGGSVQVNAQIKREKGNGPFRLIVNNCRQNKDCAGLELMDPMCTFPFLAAEIFNTGVSEWE